MPPDPLVIDDPDYASEEDPDFAPEAAAPIASDESSASDSEADTGPENPVKKPQKRKRAPRHDEEAEDVGFENSGDEEVVETSLKKQRKKGRKRLEDDDEGGEGGFVKTRRMAALAPEERKPLATTASATVDVDALWASMTSGATQQSTNHGTQDLTASISPQAILKKNQAQGSSPVRGTFGSRLGKLAEEEDLIMIQRTYNFAGKVHVEEKLVPRDSAEARLWLQSQPTGKALPQPSDPNIPKPLKPPKRARRSIFEPMNDSLPQRADLHFGVSAVRKEGTRGGAEGAVQAKKLNTVEKSKMDWAGFVDKEGIKDELETAGKAKGAYLDQKEFLARVEENREEEARRARMKV